MNESRNDTAYLYSPALITLATVLGAPVAGCILLAQNYRVIGKQATAKQILLWGIFGTILLLVVASLLPDTFPNIVLPAGYTIGMYQAVKRSHGKDYQTYLANGGAKGPIWKAVFTGILCLIAILVMVFLAVFLYSLITQSLHQ
jgi:hypothetical protein